MNLIFRIDNKILGELEKGFRFYMPSVFLQRKRNTSCSTFLWSCITNFGGMEALFVSMIYKAIADSNEAGFSPRTSQAT